MHGNAGGQGAQGRSHKIINMAVRWWCGGGWRNTGRLVQEAQTLCLVCLGLFAGTSPFRFNCLPHWQSRALFSLSSAAITLIRSNNLTYLGNVFQAKRRDVGFSKPDVLNGRRIQTGVAHWDRLLPSSSRPSPHPDSLLVSETKGGILTQSNNDVTIGKTTGERERERER